MLVVSPTVPPMSVYMENRTTKNVSLLCPRFKLMVRVRAGCGVRVSVLCNVD